MKKSNFVILGVILLIFAISYFLISNIIFTILLSCIIGICLYRFSFFIQKDQLKYKKISQAYSFCTFLNLQMLSTSNLYEAYKNIEENLSFDFQNFDGETFISQLLSLAEEYALNGFNLYCKTLILYSNQGGDFFKMTQSPFQLVQNTKIYYEKLKQQKKAKLWEISSLYFLWLFVLIFLKIGLSSYFRQISVYSIFQLGMFLILFLGFYSFIYTLKIYYFNEIKGLE